MHYSEMERYWIWLSSVDGIGVKRFYQLLSIFEDPQEVWNNISAPELKFLGAKTVQTLRAARNEKYVSSLFESLEAAQSWANDDPYIAAGVYQKVSVKPYKKVF